MRIFPHLEKPLFLDGYGLTIAKAKQANDLQGAFNELLTLSDGKLCVHDPKRYRFSIWSLPDLKRIQSGKTYANRTWLAPNGQMVAGSFGAQACIEQGPMTMFVDSLQIEFGKATKYVVTPDGPPVVLGDKPVGRAGNTHPSGTFAFAEGGNLYIGHVEETATWVLACLLLVPEGAEVEIWPGEKEAVVLAWDGQHCEGWWSVGGRFAFATETMPVRRGDELLFLKDGMVQSWSLRSGQKTQQGALPGARYLLVGTGQVLGLSEDRETFIEVGGKSLPRKLPPNLAPARLIIQNRLNLARRLTAPDLARFWDCHLDREGKKLETGIGALTPRASRRVEVAYLILDSRHLLLYRYAGVTQTGGHASEMPRLDTNLPAVSLELLEEIYQGLGQAQELEWLLYWGGATPMEPAAAARFLGLVLGHFQAPGFESHLQSPFPELASLLTPNGHLRETEIPRWVQAANHSKSAHRGLRSCLPALLRVAANDATGEAFSAS